MNIAELNENKTLKLNDDQLVDFLLSSELQKELGEKIAEFCLNNIIGNDYDELNDLLLERDNKIKELLNEVELLNKQLADNTTAKITEKNNELLKQIKTLENQNKKFKSFEEQNKILEQKNKKLTENNKELQSQINIIKNNLSNSSKYINDLLVNTDNFNKDLDDVVELLKDSGNMRVGVINLANTKNNVLPYRLHYWKLEENDIKNLIKNNVDLDCNCKYMISLFSPFFGERFFFKGKENKITYLNFPTFNENSNKLLTDTLEEIFFKNPIDFSTQESKQNLGTFKILQKIENTANTINEKITKLNYNFKIFNTDKIAVKYVKKEFNLKKRV